MSNRPELDLSLTNMNALVSLAADLMIENMKSRQGEGYFLPKEEADQLAALLIAARDYGKAELALYDGAAE